MFEGCLKGVLRVFERCLKGVLRVFERCLKGVLRVFGFLNFFNKNIFLN